MKIEAGKYYKTRDGRKVYIGAVGSPFKESWDHCEVLGWIDDDEILDNHYRWSLDGKCQDMDGVIFTDSDLVEEWKD